MTDTEQEYFQICAWRYLHPLPKEEYGEVHHILPRSCGGSDRKWNLVRLTPEEHFRCHYFLVKIFDEKGSEKERKKMLFAWRMMSYWYADKQLCPEEFAQLRKEYAKAKSESLMGHGKFKKKRKKTKAQLSRIRRNARRKMEEKKVAERCVYCGTMNCHD